MKRNVQMAAGIFACMVAGFAARGQAPGGLTPAAWYHSGSGVYSDAGTTPAANNAQVQQWSSQVGSFPMIQGNSGLRPIYSNSSQLANFNPTITFDGSNDVLEFVPATGVNVIDRASGTFYAAGFVNQLKNFGFVGFDATMDYPGLHSYGNKVLFFTGGPGYQGLTTNLFENKAFFTAAAGWQNGAGTSASNAAATVSLNGFKVDYAAGQLNNANLSINAREFRVGGDNNWGAFNGQLNEILVFEDRLTAAQMNRVETYLAIKYGKTFANGNQDYLNSSGAPVWSASANAGYQQNIAGIAHDVNGALYQKQSWSTQSGQQVLIGVGGLANTNAANTGTIADGQYLVWGDNGMARTPNVAIAGVSGISHRFASVWKAQNNGVGAVRVAWIKGLTNLSLIQSADATFDASDVITNMAANEVTINGVVYNYADVTLANGAFFTFAGKVAAPGGVSGPVVWLKADQGTTVAGNTINSWVNYGLSGGVAGALGSSGANTWALPKFGANEHNFNPAIIDDVPNTNAGSMLLPDVFDAPAQRNLSSFILHSRDNVNNSENNMIAFTPLKVTAGALEAPYMAGYRGNRPWFYWQGPYENAPTLPNSATRLNNIPSINGFYVPQWVSGTPHQTTVSMNGATATIPAYNINATSYPFGNQLFIFGDGNANNWSGGKISEVITYDKLLTDTEKLQVNSYLAIKYGITMTNSGATDVANYLNSNAAVVWDAAANAGYNKNVTGIAHDVESTLDQKQSKSVNAGQQVLVATTGLANTNALNGTSLGSGQYVIWGDNGLAKTLSVAHNTTVGSNQVNLRFAAVWKVQNTGSAGTVRVTWPTGIVNLHLIQSADATINTSDTHTEMSGTVTVNGVAYNYADVTLANGSYFTFGGYIAGPGGVGQDLSLWYRADSGVETDGANKVTGWNNSTATDVKLTMNGATAVIPYNDQTTKAWNFNPTLSFDGTNNYLRNNTTNYLTAAGSVHYITVARLNPSASGFNSIFAISGNDDGFFLYPQGGQIYPMPAIGNNFSATAAGPGTPNRYGIFSAILPKTGTPANQRGFYNGLQKVYTPGYPITGGAYTLPTFGAYIGADGTTGDNPNGDIAEVIVYHEPAGGDMTNANLARIHSYLAIKYGVTLDQSTPQNYVSSSNAVVRDAAANAGYQNNIAGIARDDQGGLYQKQSASINPGSQVIVGTTGLANTNAANTAALTNGQFLIWGDNGLAKAPGVSFGTIAGLPYNRFAALWKVENTSSVGTVRVAWQKGYANLKLVRSADDVIDLSDNITDMTATMMIGDKEYAYADVTLDNGSYFTFAAFVQGPGGVTNNLSYWYRADKLVDATSEGADVLNWTDFTAGTTISQMGESAVPVYKNGDATYFNFNPGLNYTNVNQALGNITVPTVSALDFDIYTLTKEGVNPGGNGRVFSSLVNNTNLSGNIAYWDGIGIMADQRLERVTNTFASRYLANPGGAWSTTAPNITYNTFSDVSLGRAINGTLTPSNGTHTARGLMTGGHAIGSTQFLSNGSDNAGFTGNIGEVVIYGSGKNTAAERNKVESYLAIKYGVTLVNTNNYTTSQDVVVWDATANGSHYNNVAGIGNDVVSALLQKQSRSQHTNANNQVTIGLGDIAATNIANSGSLADGQFLVWGDNGNTQAMTNAAGTYTAFVYSGSINNARRMNRVWKVQNTGVGQEVKIRFPMASVGTTTLANDACAGNVIIYASDAAFTTNVVAVPLTENGTDYEAMRTFPAGASYFTFGRVTPTTTGTVYLPAVVEETTEYNDNCGTGEWTYFRKSGDASLKYFATSNVAPAVLNGLTVTVRPEGVTYMDGAVTTSLMPRITTVVDESGTPFTGAKVRVYYSASEMAATQLPGAQVNAWFKYEGTSDEALASVYSFGKLEAAKATQLTPDASGIEDGVNYVEFHNITSFSSFVYISTTAESALPVTLTYFKAAKEGGIANLAWATAEEVNNKGFEIQRSTDARNWNTIGFVENQTESGNSKGALTYNFKDAAPVTGTNYYRLKQIDFDGKYMYSAMATLQFDEVKAALSVYPNPVFNGRLSLNLPHAGSYKASIYNVAGVEVMRANQSGDSLDIQNLRAGLYVIRIVYANGESHSKTFVVK